ncbi:MAG: hypothetical protein GY828_03370 [Candidatus Gracilibacteria bacterium]|nr:hypothetical protein [Candidatus Gracilibacteria bacterium]
MYYNGFYIDKPLGNNAFSFEQRNNKKIWVPKLINATIPEICLGDKVVFEDFDFNDKLSSNTGLENFYHIKWKGKDIYLFDNHNHAYFFWYLARSEGIIGDQNTLIHIDEHADTRDPGEYLLKPESQDLEKIFHYTNYVYNVGNYIIPAQKEGIISDVIQIRNSHNLENYMGLRSSLGSEIILNLDLDFFQPDLDFIDYDMKKKVVLDAANKAKVITVATSPFFINQELALEVFRDIFEK